MNLFVQNLRASQFPRTHNDPRVADEIKFRSFLEKKKTRIIFEHRVCEKETERMCRMNERCDEISKTRVGMIKGMIFETNVNI